MSGKLLTVLPKTVLDFTNSGYTTVYTPLIHPVDTLEYIEATFIVRVHARAGSGGRVYISLHPDGWFEGTSQSFLGNLVPTSLAPANPLVIDTFTPIPTLMLLKTTAPGRYLTLATQANTGISVTISIDVCLRSPDEELVLARINENGELELVEPAEKPCCCPKCQAPGESRGNGAHEVGAMLQGLP